MPGDVKEDSLRLKTALPLGLAILLAPAASLVASCGGASSNIVSKATLTAALTEFEQSAGTVTAALTAGTDSTAATEIKAAKADMKAKWQKVIAAAKDVKGADVKGAEAAWTNVQTAIDSLPDNATLAQAGAALKSPMEGLMQVDAELWSLVGNPQ
jgi:hypothetical protein